MQPSCCLPTSFGITAVSRSARGQRIPGGIRSDCPDLSLGFLSDQFSSAAAVADFFQIPNIISPAQWLPRCRKPAPRDYGYSPPAGASYNNLIFTPRGQLRLNAPYSEEPLTWTRATDFATSPFISRDWSPAIGGHRRARTEPALSRGSFVLNSIPTGSQFSGEPGNPPG